MYTSLELMDMKWRGALSSYTAHFCAYKYTRDRNMYT